VEWLAQLPSVPELQQNSLTVKAEAGQLRVEMLAPAEPFASRQPTSPHVDIPGPFSTQGIHTYGVKSSGAALDFIALLEPSFSRDTLPSLKAAVAEQKPGFVHLLLQGSGWTDHVFQSAAAEPVELKDAGVKSTARITTVRLDAKGITSCLAVKVTSFELPGIKIAPTNPATIGLQQMPNGSWILDADQEVVDQIKAEKPFSVQPMERGTNRFRYLIAKGGTTPKQASEWLASLIVFRDKALIPVRAPAAQPPLPASILIPVEAESFEHQEQGTADVVEGKPGAVGKSIRGFGNAAPDHQITWTFEAPQSGQYQLTIRYATNLPDVTVGLLMDGASPIQALTKLAMPSTGGWSIKENNWRDWVVRDDQGKPVVFHLSKGKHELRLAKPTGALALDRFIFNGTGE
jgi:hypothetical protein